MNLSKRQKCILNYLVQEDKFITAKELSGELNVSEKTIYREIKGIKEKHVDCTDMIINHIGKGFKINYNKYIKQLKILNGNLDKNHALSTGERRDKILIDLLFSSPERTSINNLSELFMISTSSISNDILYIKSVLKSTEVNLKSTSQGTFIYGTELNIRELLKNVIINSITNNDYSYDLILLQNHFSYENISFTKELLDYINSKENSIEDPYYINLFVYVLVTISRLKENHFLGEEANFIKTKENSEKIHNITCEIIKRLSSYTMSVLNNHEKENIYHLISTSSVSNLNYSIENDINKDIDGEYLISFLVNRMVEECSAKYFDNSELKRNLYPHIRLMIARIKNNIKINNPLLEEIEQECEFIFNTLKKIIHNSEELNYINNISDDELGYLTLYFQYFYEQHLQSLRVLIVCSTGIGTSHLLKGRVLRSFPKWNIIDILSSSKIKNVNKYRDIDLVLTTVNLPEHNSDIPVVHVSTFLNERDIENILNTTRLLENN